MNFFNQSELTCKNFCDERKRSIKEVPSKRISDHEHGQAVYTYEYQRGIINSRYELVSRTH